jgi:riboflavin-specific deaminase-like protein
MAQKKSKSVLRNKPRFHRDRPFIFINVATTADGKIAPSSHTFEPFGSARDQELLLELRTRADAIICGAHTLNSFPIKLSPGGEKYRKMRLKNGLAEYNLRVVVSGSGNISAEAEIFKHHFSPIIVLTTERASLEKCEELRALGAEVKICGKTELDFVAACRWLREEWNVKTLLCEGGGELNAALLEAGLVDEIYQTICPVIFGGRSAPTMAGGRGVSQLNNAIKLKLKSMRRVGDELFLVHEVIES